MVEDIAVIADAGRARVVLPALRQRILAAAQEPRSSTAIAAELGLPRQRVNYHVRTLARAGLLRRAGRVQRRGLVEQRWLATARSVVIAPPVDRALAPDPRALGPDLGAAYAIALAATVQREVADGARAARRRGERPPTLALDAELRFESAAQRARFAAALQDGIRRAIAEHTTASAAGPAYRLALACYPKEVPDVAQTAPRPSRTRRDHDRRAPRRGVARVG